MNKNIDFSPINPVSSGLVIAEPWIGMLLDGTKTWEMRSKPTNKRGWVALIKKGTGHVFGLGYLSECRPSLDLNEMVENIENHKIPVSMIYNGEIDNWTTPWVFSQVIKLAKPIPYKHQAGAVIWVTLDALCSEGLKEALTSANTNLSNTIKPNDEKKMKLIGITTLTQGNLNNNHFYLRPFIDRFPSDLIGGKNKDNPAKRTAKIFAGSDVIETDIDGEKMLFRARGWVRSFLKQKNAQAGDQVAVYEVAPYEYNVEILHSKN